MPKTSEVKFEPGWLMKTAQQAEIRMMAGHSRRYCQQYSLAFSFPIGWDKAEEVLAHMSEVFKSWTGRTIEEHIAARPASSPPHAAENGQAR